ncbi:MAG: cytochrome c biogenesis CcdA family protein [Rhodothermales bacterium]
MSLELASIPLAFVAGVLGVLSPCVWPLVPVVMSSAASSGKWGPVMLGLGLSVSFAVAGTVLTFVLVNTGLDPELVRYLGAGLLIVIALTLLVRPLGNWLTVRLSLLSGRFRIGSSTQETSAAAQFGVGALLGVVWLPCVGPTLGAAIGLASLGQSMGIAFIVMLAFGIGTAGTLLVAGVASKQALAKWRPELMSKSGLGKKLLGWTLLILGLLVLTGADKILEAVAIGMLPEWVFSL